MPLYGQGDLWYHHRPPTLGGGTWEARALQNASGERRVCHLDHAIEVYGCLPFHGIIYFIQFLSHVSHHLIIVMC